MHNALTGRLYAMHLRHDHLRLWASALAALYLQYLGLWPLRTALRSAAHTVTSLLCAYCG